MARLHPTWGEVSSFRSNRPGGASSQEGETMVMVVAGQGFVLREDEPPGNWVRFDEDSKLLRLVGDAPQ